MMLFRSKFNKLVSELREQGNLNEENLRKVTLFLRKDKLRDILLFAIAFPFFLYGLYIINLYVSGYRSAEFDDQKFWLIIIMVLTVLILFFCAIYKTQKTRWRYVYLMTEGCEAQANVTFFSKNYNSSLRWCEYFFYSDQGYQYKGVMKIPVNFDDKFEFIPGEIVNVKYCSNDPNFNMIVSKGFKYFNLKKGNV